MNIVKGEFFLIQTYLAQRKLLIKKRENGVLEYRKCLLYTGNRKIGHPSIDRGMIIKVSKNIFLQTRDSLPLETEKNQFPITLQALPDFNTDITYHFPIKRDVFMVFTYKQDGMWHYKVKKIEESAIHQISFFYLIESNR